ncbi:hypothetical protein EDF57_10141 [Novosphingobium sp. PhB55]|uniref:hypothetical protein n=1 Tax=Novosphingobium sp. PhB55 TaxID=2485106 RepID=UPI0010E5085A|nr:hypothetical protein [Novosphingobium sp. PhB55]TDW68169.1 hypothetical protein EDF57_10141 [Novosphingobium sp. PhB55]
MTPRLNLLLLILVLLLGVPLYWFQFDASAPGAKPLPITMSRLRELAEGIPGPAPVALRQEVLGYHSELYNRIAAGSGLRPVRLALRAFELVVPGRAPILIDAGTTPVDARKRDVEDFNFSAQRRVDEAAEIATMKLVLLDRPLHRGNPALASPDAVPLPDLGDGEPRAVAPGVVAIPLKGLPDRAMMVYIRLEDGREYLFTGDVAKIDANWMEGRPPARTFATMRNGDERRLTVSWLMTIKALKRAAPAMIVVSGHEPRDVAGIASGFAKDRSQSAGQASGHVPIDHVFARSNG